MVYHLNIPLDSVWFSIYWLVDSLQPNDSGMLKAKENHDRNIKYGAILINNAQQFASEADLLKSLSFAGKQEKGLKKCVNKSDFGPCTIQTNGQNEKKKNKMKKSMILKRNK